MIISEKTQRTLKTRKKLRLKVIILTVLIPLLLTVIMAIGIMNPVLGNFMRLPEHVVDNAERLKKHVEFLASIYPSRNYVEIGSLNKAAQYIKKHFQLSRFEPEEQSFTVQGKTYQNIIVRAGPKQGERIIIGAHYDVAGLNNPGADDNASGVAGILELARLISERKPHLEHPIELVAYTLEEPPFFGSQSMGSAKHADRLKKQNQKVALMISLEMIGYFSNEKFSQSYPLGLLYLTYPNRGNFIALVGTPKDWFVTRKVKKLFKTGTDLPLYSLNAPRFLPGVELSDHFSYLAHNWPALMITDTAFFRNKAYHLPSDTPDRLDYKKMAQVIDGVYSIVTRF